VFSRDEYNESSESFNANENDVASLFNLKNMCQKEASPIGRSNWHRKDCDIQDLEGVFLAKGHMTAFDSKEAIMDNILGDDHVALTILYYPRNISMLMLFGNGY